MDTRGIVNAFIGTGASATSEHLTHMVASYQRRIETLEREVAELRSVLGMDRSVPSVLPDAEARALIKKFFVEHDGEVFYPDDVAEALDLDLGQAIKVCRELTAEGKLAEKSSQ